MKTVEKEKNQEEMKIAMREILIRQRDRNEPAQK